MRRETCVYCAKPALIQQQDALLCCVCGIVQPAISDCVAIPLDLLCDLNQLSHWLHHMVDCVRSGNPVDEGLLELMKEQSVLVQAWAAEYLPNFSATNSID